MCYSLILNACISIYPVLTYDGQAVHCALMNEGSIMQLYRKIIPKIAKDIIHALNVKGLIEVEPELKG